MVGMLKSPRLLPVTVLVFAGLTLAACTRPTEYRGEGMIKYRDRVTYKVTPAADGFRLLVNHWQYQFVPARGRSHEACRLYLMEIAGVEARRRGRAIQPVRREAIRVDSGRNILSGNTTCAASYDVKWAS